LQNIFGENIFKILTSVRGSFSNRLSRHDVDNCFKEYDRDRDNRLSYNEFCMLMNSHRPASEEIQVTEANFKILIWSLQEKFAPS
jgi:Ca2+-binding EF-hand superfamily protein